MAVRSPAAGNKLRNTPERITSNGTRPRGPIQFDGSHVRPEHRTAGVVRARSTGSNNRDRVPVRFWLLNM